jgi:hypothetical protein
MPTPESRLHPRLRHGMWSEEDCLLARDPGGSPSPPRCPSPARESLFLVWRSESVSLTGTPRPASNLLEAPLNPPHPSDSLSRRRPIAQRLRPIRTTQSPRLVSLRAPPPRPLRRRPPQGPPQPTRRSTSPLGPCRRTPLVQAASSSSTAALPTRRARQAAPLGSALVLRGASESLRKSRQHRPSHLNSG